MSKVIDFQSRLEIANLEGFLNQRIELTLTMEEATKLYAACCGVAILVNDPETRTMYNELADLVEKLILNQVKKIEDKEEKH